MRSNLRKQRDANEVLMDAPGGLHGRYATFTSEDQSRLDWMDNQLSDTTHEEFVQGSSNDADWEDVWGVCGYIMRLYRSRGVEEQTRVFSMVSKKGVRQWLEDWQPSDPHSQ